MICIVQGCFFVEVSLGEIVGGYSSFIPEACSLYKGDNIACSLTRTGKGEFSGAAHCFYSYIDAIKEVLPDSVVYLPATGSNLRIGCGRKEHLVSSSVYKFNQESYNETYQSEIIGRVDPRYRAALKNNVKVALGTMVVPDGVGDLALYKACYLQQYLSLPLSLFSNCESSVRRRVRSAVKTVDRMKRSNLIERKNSIAFDIVKVDASQSTGTSNTRSIPVVRSIAELGRYLNLDTHNLQPNIHCRHVAFGDSEFNSFINNGSQLPDITNDRRLISGQLKSFSLNIFSVFGKFKFKKFMQTELENGVNFISPNGRTLILNYRYDIDVVLSDYNLLVAESRESGILKNDVVVIEDSKSMLSEVDRRYAFASPGDSGGGLICTKFSEECFSSCARFVEKAFDRNKGYIEADKRELDYEFSTFSPYPSFKDKVLSKCLYRNENLLINDSIVKTKLSG